MSPLEIKIERFIAECYSPTYILVGLNELKAIQTLDKYRYFKGIHWYRHFPVITTMSTEYLIKVLECDNE